MLLKRSLGRGIANKTNDCLAYSVFITELVLVCLWRVLLFDNVVCQLKGVTDCTSEVEKSGLLCRQEPIGYDRHRRKYWFMCRRIIM